MAILRQRLNRKNAGGSYDTIHLETESGLVLRSDGTTVEDALAAGGVFSRMNATAAITSSDLAEDDLVLIGDADGSTVRKVTLSELATYFGTTAGNDPTTEFTVLAQPTVLSVSNGSGGTPAKNLNDALTQMKDSYGLMYHYYRLQDALTGVLYYVACESTIGSDTPSVTGSYVSTADPTKWYTNSTLNFLNTSNITADFTYLEEPVVESASGGSSVSTSGGSLDTTLIKMIKAYPNHKRYHLQNEGGTSYYILTTTTVNADTESITGAIYATATGTYYTGATITMVSTIPDEFPDPDSLTIGNNIYWANQQWIVSHKTADTCYLTLKGLSGQSTWYNLQSACTSFAGKFTEAQKACLKSVTAGNTSGKVFVATKDQMDGGFSYFNSDSRRRLNEVYWTSTEDGSVLAWFVRTAGSLIRNVYKTDSYGFRPSVAISTKELCNDHDISDELDDSKEEDSDEEPVPVMDLNKAIRWAGINWRPLQQDDDLLYLTPYEPTDDLKLCTFSKLEDVAAEWGAKHLSDSDQSALVPIQINGKSYNVAPITLEHILNIPDARNAKHAQICMPYGNVPYWTGSSAYNGGDTDVMVWCMNEKGQNVPVNKDAFLAFRPMICLHVINALVGNLDDEEKPIALTPNISTAYPSAGMHVYWAGNDWIVTHVDLKMVYMTLSDVVPEWHVTWDDLQEACYEWAKKTFSVKKLKKLVPITCGNTHGKVWVASKRLMENGLAYFAESEEHRTASCRYWTSTEYSNVSAWNVDANGDIFELNGIKTCQHGFRPSICMLRSNFGPEDRTVGHYENAEIVNGCRTLIATGMQVMWANQRWIVSNIQPEIIMLTLAHSIPDLMDWEDLQDTCNAWGNENLGDQKSKLAYLLVGGICGKVFVATKSDMNGGFDYFTDDDSRCLGECYWTSTKDANGTVYYVDETGKIQSVSGQAMCLDTAPKFTFRPTVAIWTKEFCNDNGVKVVSD